MKRQGQSSHHIPRKKTQSPGKNEAFISSYIEVVGAEEQL
jgi:hypothetical protein